MRFSTALETKQKYMVKHKALDIDPEHWKNEFESTSIEELEFVRSPFYDLAMLEHAKEGEETEKLLTSFMQK